MMKLLAVLVPIVVFAQVEIDTVIHLSTEGLGQGFYIAELNKMYLSSSEGYLVLDCSTYQVTAQIPSKAGLAHFSWNGQRQKLYITGNPRPDSTLVVDAAADTVLRWLDVCYEFHTDAYLSDVDRRFKPAGDTLYEFECAADTVVRRLLFGGHGGTCASWDSAGRKLYVGLLSNVYVYDYLTDSLLKVIDVSTVRGVQPDALLFSSTHRKAYVAPFQAEPWLANVGIIDTERDSLVGVLPVRIWRGLYAQAAVNELDGKVYLADSDAEPGTPDTLWVIDCATDSVVKKVEYQQQGWGVRALRWVPWSNRLYLVSVDTDYDSSAIVVFDCSTDSIIEPGMRLGWVPQDIELDPVRERIFVIGAGHTNVYVLRDTGLAGIAETRQSGIVPNGRAKARVIASFDGVAVEYQLPAAACVRATLHDAVGRQLGVLDAGSQQPGTHRLSWNQARGGRKFAAGAYFVLLDMGAEKATLKAIIR